jgi:hypothetical protein
MLGGNLLKLISNQSIGNGGVDAVFTARFDIKMAVNQEALTKVFFVLLDSVIAKELEGIKSDLVDHFS